jgi:diguanylate cyclase (GGDEF)-like protein
MQTENRTGTGRTAATLAGARPLGVVLAAGVLAAAFALLAAHLLLGLGGEGRNDFYDHWLYDGLMVAAAGICLARVLRPGHRLAWLLIGLALLAFAAGDVYWTMALADDGGATFPSLADVGYLAFYPLALAGIVVLVAGHLRGRPGGLWLDAAALSLAVASVGATVLLETVRDGLAGDPAALFEGLAYPIADLLLLSFLAAIAVLCGRRPGRTAGLLMAALATTALADAVYSYQLSSGGYMEGGWLDLLWPLSALLAAAAAWAPAESPVAARPATGWRSLLVVGGVSVGILALYVYSHLRGEDLVTELLLVATIVAVLARLVFTFAENRRLIERISLDSLTGLGNRGQLELDLRQALSAGTPSVLAICDLDGFKRYNDSFGHPAGDALLARLARRLAGAVDGLGRAYRVGGDEFCVLLPGGSESGPERLDWVAEALSEHGHGFIVSASLGWVELPREAESPEAAIQLADRRMYERKETTRLTATDQAVAVLARAQRERTPDVSEHTRDVAELAVAVGRRSGLDADELSLLARAAELHGIGKVAIPDPILEKRGSLTPEEVSFVRRHPVVGERILAAAADLLPVARIVRSSHERYDGSGYPDGLAGDQIPICSRIIHVCDAFCALTNPRPHAEPVPPREALLELRRCAGSQFDPAIVSAFGQALAAGEPDEVDREMLDRERRGLRGWLVPRPLGPTT